MTKKMQSGTRIEFHGTPAMGGFPAVTPEQAVIARWNEKISGPRMPGWHVVKFADGGKLIAHETRFRVIDNR